MSPVADFLGTWLAFASMVLAGAFIFRYSLRPWFGSLAGRIVMGMSAISCAVSARAFIVREFGPFSWQDWIGPVLFAATTVVLVALHHEFTKAQKERD